MELDTGVAMSVIREGTYRALKKYPQLGAKRNRGKAPHTYTGEQVKVIGQIKMSSMKSKKQYYQY